MRILHVFKNYYPETQGGVEEAIRQICIGTSGLGARNTVLTLADNGGATLLEREEAKVIRFQRDLEVASCGISLRALKAFRRHAEAADVVHYHFPWPFADLMHLAIRVRKPAVVTYHSDVVRQRLLAWLYAPLMRRFFGRVDSIAATSPNYFASSRVLQQFSEKVEVVPIGLDETSYPALDCGIAAGLESSVGRGFFLFVGVLRYYKGLNILLDAVAGTDLPVVIAGAGPAEPELRAKQRELGLTNVQFLGHVSNAEKVALYHLAGAVVFPSHLRSEAFGVTLVEGAMYAKALISTEIGTGTSYVNVDEETGLVVPPADSKGLREGMQRLAADGELAARMGAKARERFDRLFTASLMGQRYSQIYSRLV